jgi:hypothetical protein
MRFKPSVVGWRDGRQVLVETEIDAKPVAVIRAFDTPGGTVLFRARDQGPAIAEACRMVVRVNSLRAAEVLVLEDGTVVAGPPRGELRVRDGAIWMAERDPTLAELAARIGMPVGEGVPDTPDEVIRIADFGGAGPVAAALRRALERTRDVEPVELWPAPHAADAVA